MLALARVVFTSREHVIALEPRGKGLLGVTLRYPYEVRKEDEYFEDIEDEKIPKDMLELPHTSSRRRQVTSSLRNLKTNTKTRSRN
jgi:non-homologous end joining protein Ku